LDWKVYPGKTISTIYCFWFEPLYFYLWDGTTDSEYFLTYAKYGIATLATGVATYQLVGLFSRQNQYVSFLIAMFLCASLPNLIFWILYGRMQEFSAVVQMVKKVLRKRRHKV
jgi:hypothetical protein